MSCIFLSYTEREENASLSIKPCSRAILGFPRENHGDHGEGGGGERGLTQYMRKYMGRHLDVDRAYL